MRGRRRALHRGLIAVLLGALLAVPASAGAFEVDVAATYFAFSPQDADLLSGDTVNWSNVSTRAHTVTADDATSFSSPRLEPGDGFSHTFAAVGTFPYHCSIHPEIRGTVRVRNLLLDGPTAPVDAGSAVALHGRAHPGIGEVTIERDEGSGFAPLQTVAPGPDGRFDAQVAPSRTTVYRAVAGGAVSDAVRILVFEHPQFDVDVNSSQKDRTIVHVHVLPKRANQLAVLQLHQREHFGWWPVARGKLNNNSRVRFKIEPSRAKARVVLTLGDGATVLAQSKPFRLR